MLSVMDRMESPRKIRKTLTNTSYKNKPACKRSESKIPKGEGWEGNEALLPMEEQTGQYYRPMLLTGKGRGGAAIKKITKAGSLCNWYNSTGGTRSSL